MIRTRFTFRGTQGLVANFHAADRRVGALVRRRVQYYGRRVQELTRRYAAYRSGFMRDHVGVWFTANGLVFTVGWDPADFAAAGRPFYPPYLEFGTRKMAARPALYPAYRDVEPQFVRSIGEAVKAALEQRGATGASSGGIW